jgi:hypothetical protein
MKNFLLTLGMMLAAAALSFGVFYALNDEPATRRAAREGDALAWLRAEFHLDDAQFAAVKKLHDDYNLVCADHCAEIMAARQRPAPPAELAALEAKCVESMEDHFRRVAALMPPPEGERYLATVLPRIADYDHAAAPTVQVHP